MKTPSLLLLASLLIPVAQAADPRVISVRGEGELKVAPDVAVISLNVRTKAKDAKAAQAANARELARLTKTLQGDFAIEPKLIQSTGLSVAPEYRYEKDGKQVFLGFEANHGLSVRVKKLERVGEILDQLPAAKGGDQLAVLLHGVSFDSDRRREHETEALGLAMANAEARAKALAGFAKKGLKGVLRISDSNVSYQPFAGSARMAGKMMTMADESAGAGTSVSPGEITISSNVGVEYEMD